MSIPATDHLVYWSIQDQCIPVNTGIIKHRSDLGGLLDFWLNLVTLGRPWSINIPFAVALPVSALLLQIGGNQYENDISAHNTKWIENISDDTLHSIVVSRIGSHGIQSARKRGSYSGQRHGYMHGYRWEIFFYICTTAVKMLFRIFKCSLFAC